MAAKNITILGIDTSCDDTAIALLEVKNNNFKILSNVVSSQVKLHAKYGGVYPFLAKREHQKNLPIVFNKVLRQGGARFDLIGVTNGPGLEPCLWQGINFAKELAQKFNKPLVPVNHIEAHVLANWLVYKNILFPAVCLVVSGGHTQLILMKEVGKYELIGETRDDAAGECFDKVARILGLGYPGGPAIAKLARKYREPFSIHLPRPMLRQKNYDFSFSGLKTAVLYRYKALPNGRQAKSKSQKFIRAMAFDVQQAIIDVLLRKTIRAARDYRVKSIILGGGVAANDELRRQFKSVISNQQSAIRFFVPPKNLCTDNAAMVAATASFHQKNIKKDMGAEANLRI